MWKVFTGASNTIFIKNKIGSKTPDGTEIMIMQGVINPKDAHATYQHHVLFVPGTRIMTKHNRVISCRMIAWLEKHLGIKVPEI